MTGRGRVLKKCEILENLGKYSNSTLQNERFKKTSNKYFFTYATFLNRFRLPGTVTSLSVPSWTRAEQA